MIEFKFEFAALLSNLGVINIEKKRSAKLDLDEFVDYSRITTIIVLV